MRLITAALFAALALAIMVQPAVAARSLSIEGETTLSLNGNMTFRGESVEVICPITLVRTMSRFIPKIIGILKGRVIAVILPAPRTCRTSTGTLTEITPLEVERGAEEVWRLYYRGFTGTLPSIIKIRLRIAGFRIRIVINILGTPVACLFEGEIENDDNLGREGLLTETTIVEPSTLALREGSGLCPRRVEVRGTLRPLNTVRYRLV
ncbi:MAG TPA: hypothetical protein VE972_01765 [Conexibacter sp.]|nr:hypothetical protein [Conexibacter sp.]